MKVPVADLSETPSVSEILSKVRKVVNDEDGYQSAKANAAAQKTQLDTMKGKALPLPS